MKVVINQDNCNLINYNLVVSFRYLPFLFEPDKIYNVTKIKKRTILPPNTYNAFYDIEIEDFNIPIKTIKNIIGYKIETEENINFPLMFFNIINN